MSERGFAGSVVAVTGAAGEIGRAIVGTFVQAGAQVIGIDIQAPEARREGSEFGSASGNWAHYTANLTKEDETEAVFEQIRSRYGQLDVLVNGAGGSRSPDIVATSACLWREELDRNLTSAFLSTKTALRSMIKRRSGSIVNISSANAVTGAGEAAYSAAKAGLISLTYNTAVRYGCFGIRANSICLGVVDAGPVWHEAKAKHPNIMKELAAEIPTKRVGTPADVAAIVLFLASGASRLINGANIMADGGWSIAAGMTYTDLED